MENGAEYFARNYSPTAGQVKEMEAICNAFMLNDGTKGSMLLSTEEEHDDTTKGALNKLFFPSKTDHQSVFLRSGEIHFYNSKDGDKNELFLFSRGFVFASTFVSSDNKDLQERKKVDSAYMFSDIDKIETMDEWNEKQVDTYLNGDIKTLLSRRVFAMFVCKRKYPLVIICNTANDVTTWMEAFEICVSEQKTMALGKNRESVVTKGTIFGINNPERLRSRRNVWDRSSLDWGAEIDLDDDDF